MRQAPVTGQWASRPATSAGSLIDEVHVDLVPVFLGAGTHLFGDLVKAPRTLEQLRVAKSAGVPHLYYQVR